MSVCESRDCKGLYEKARKGLLKGFTGIDSPYEVPESPDVNVDTSVLSTNQSVEKIIQKLAEHVNYYFVFFSHIFLTLYYSLRMFFRRH